ncbi:hypothetical protein TWF481_003158 [Arthrobotrys musiformis]|uniref:BTB domain-containing protein n=1 Tax=Arthrobotrys musiformis TaxID=47236 RepID=A0AAV9VVS3_9PEZI
MITGLTSWLTVYASRIGDTTPTAQSSALRPKSLPISIDKMTSVNMTLYGYTVFFGCDSRDGKEVWKEKTHPHPLDGLILYIEDVDGNVPEMDVKSFLDKKTPFWLGEMMGVFAMDITLCDLILESSNNVDKFWAFEVHRGIACNWSRYISDRCRYKGAAGEAETIRGLDININSMKTVIRFMYAGVYEIMGYEVNGSLDYPRLEPQGTDGSMMIASKILSDIKAATDLQMHSMVRAIMNAIFFDLREFPYKGSLIGLYAIRMLCKLFCFRGPACDWNREKLAELIVRFQPADYIESELASLVDNKPDGRNIMFHTGGFHTILERTFKEWKGVMGLGPRMVFADKWDYLNGPPRPYQQCFEPAWCHDCDPVEPILELQKREPDDHFFFY